MPKIHAPELISQVEQSTRQSWIRRGVKRLIADLGVWFLHAAALALIAGSPAIALAQSNGARSAAALSMKSSCQGDYRAHCVGSDPSAPIAAACLAQFYINLSKSCQAALDAYNAPQSEPEEQ